MRIPPVITKTFKRHPGKCECGGTGKFLKTVVARGYTEPLYGAEWTCTRCGMNLSLMLAPKRRIIGTPWYIRGRE